MKKSDYRILVVDDHPDVRESLARLLQHAGYTVDTAPNGIQALKVQAERPAHVLITDIFMPEHDGVEIITAFRKQFPATRVLAMSGDAPGSAKQDYLEVAELVGAELTLRKPFPPEALLKKLESLLPA